ncbi:universal stress protein [Litchfieldia alkalitelluris]|uniref:universal stress protein n=1 Tax=Litchfieldia alkalitelluris TaxID=304268 RepID=UPI0009984B11|nr:universal stress protein [Litchfieldia alkalitelluris]
MFSKILLASDGSNHAVRAAEKAAYIASGTPNAVLEIVYVVDSTTSKTDVLHNGNTELIEQNRKQRLEKTEELLKAKNIDYKITLLHGDAGPSIVDYANDQDFNLVVLGSRGLNALQEMVLGSVSHKVAKRVNCPVLIVK